MKFICAQILHLPLRLDYIRNRAVPEGKPSNERGKMAVRRTEEARDGSEIAEAASWKARVSLRR